RRVLFRSDLLTGLAKIAKIWISVGKRGCADRDEHDLRLMQSLRRVLSETNPIENRSQHFPNARLVDRRSSVPKRIDLVGVNVETAYVMTHVRQTKAGCQANVPGSDYADFHVNTRDVFPC